MTWYKFDLPQLSGYMVNILYHYSKVKKKNRIGVKGENWEWKRNEEIQITSVALPCPDVTVEPQFIIHMLSLFFCRLLPSHSFNFQVTPHSSFLTLTLMLFTFFTSLPSTLFWDTNTLPVPRFQWLHVSLPSLYSLFFSSLIGLQINIATSKGAKILFPDSVLHVLCNIRDCVVNVIPKCSSSFFFSLANSELPRCGKCDVSMFKTG